MGLSYIRSWHQGAVKPIRRGHCGPGPGLEVLEERSVPATFTVTYLNDTGPGSLRLEGDPTGNLIGAECRSLEWTSTSTDYQT